MHSICSTLLVLVFVIIGSCFSLPFKPERGQINHGRRRFGGRDRANGDGEPGHDLNAARSDRVRGRVPNRPAFAHGPVGEDKFDGHKDSLRHRDPSHLAQSVHEAQAGQARGRARASDEIKPRFRAPNGNQRIHGVNSSRRGQQSIRHATVRPGNVPMHRDVPRSMVSREHLRPQRSRENQPHDVVRRNALPQEHDTQHREPQRDDDEQNTDQRNVINEHRSPEDAEQRRGVHPQAHRRSEDDHVNHEADRSHDSFAAGDDSIVNDPNHGDDPRPSDNEAVRITNVDSLADGGDGRMQAILKNIAEMRQEFGGDTSMAPDDEGTIMPPDHLVGLPLERDGDSNIAMHREAFFGKELDAVKKMSRSSTMRHLRVLFMRADSNRDHELDPTELGEWIHERGTEHRNQAQARNREDFTHVDKDGDGELEWDEYMRHIQHMRPSDIKRHAPKRLSKAIWRDIQREKSGARVPVTDRLRFTTGNSTLQRLLVRDLRRWRNADSDSDMKLSEGEFFGFRHPEYNHATLVQFVTELISELDQNDDGRLTVDEYLSSKGGSRSDAHIPAAGTVDERRRQFSELIDVDTDGVATAEELEQFLDPLSPQSSINSALLLVRKVDDDTNSRVSWEEMVAHQDLFLHNHQNSLVERSHNEL